MTIHIIGTVNGVENEGMRNVATHLGRVFEKEHKVLYSGLKSLPTIIINSVKSDVTIIFARANKLVYRLAQVVSRLSTVWIVFVQKPENKFIELQNRCPLKCNFFTLLENDIIELKHATDYKTCILNVGINAEKFVPVSKKRQRELKLQYGFDPNKLLVAHVGHCSSGRGLESFCKINSSQIQRLVVASGMFESNETINTLNQAGVQIHRGYLEHVEEIYQMADAYFFPTRSSEFVISIPLSVMEALACGTPVVGYESFTNLKFIKHKKDSMTLIGEKDLLDQIISEVAEHKQATTLLESAFSWDEAAQAALLSMKGEF